MGLQRVKGTCLACFSARNEKRATPLQEKKRRGKVGEERPKEIRCFEAPEWNKRFWRQKPHKWKRARGREKEKGLLEKKPLVWRSETLGDARWEICTGCGPAGRETREGGGAVASRKEEKKQSMPEKKNGEVLQGRTNQNYRGGRKGVKKLSSERAWGGRPGGCERHRPLREFTGSTGGEKEGGRSQDWYKLGHCVESSNLFSRRVTGMEKKN